MKVTEAYDEATAAEQRGDWPAAVEGYAAVLALDPERAGVQEKLDRSRRGVEVAALQAELREHVAAEDWPAAVAVADELKRLSPDDSDPDGLATTARSALHQERQTEKRQEEKKQEHEQKQQPPPSQLPKYVLAAVILVLLGGGITWVWALAGGGDGSPGGGSTDGGPTSGGSTASSPPAPFQSAALYELARHHFEPTDCSPVDEPSDAPLAWEVPHTEALKCYRPDGSYTGTLLCAGDEADFMTIRGAYLDKAVDDPQPVTELPAGRTEPWPFQVSFIHEGGGAGRVYWDDPGSLCAVELQVFEPSVEVAVDHFTAGTGS